VTGRRPSTRRAPEYTTLFRAITAAERASIDRTRGFSNIEGIETKYFARSLAGAQTYARQAAHAFGDGPFTIVRTKVRTSLIGASMRVTVDGNIDSVTVPTHLLDCLSRPEVIGSAND